MTEPRPLDWPIQSSFGQRLMHGEAPVLWSGGTGITPGTVDADIRDFYDPSDLVDYRITMFQWGNPDGMDAPWPGGIIIAYYHPTEVYDAARGGARMEKHWSTVGFIPEGEYKNVHEAMAAIQCIECPVGVPKPTSDFSRMELLFED